MRGSSGQGTIEYVAIVAVVALALALGGAVAGGPSLANAVGRSLRHALCRVGAGTCATVDPAPCVVRTTTLKGGIAAKIVLLKVGRDSAIVRTERSDGTVDVTLLDDGRAGVLATIGAKGRIQLGGTSVGAGAAAEATLLAALGGGRTWRLRDAREADALVHRLKVRLAARAGSALPGIGPLLDLGQRVVHRGAHADLPPPDSSIVTGGLTAEAKALLGPIKGATGKLGGVIGRKRAKDGSTTWLLRLSAEAGRPLRRVLGVTRTGSGEVSLAVTYDAHGRMQRLDLGAVGRHGKRAAVPDATVGLQVQGGGAVQVAAALDLSGGDDVLVRGVLAALRPDRVSDLPGAVAALAGAVADRAAIDVTTYRESRAGIGLDVSAGLGAGVGATAELSRTRSTLTGAWSRPPGGAWEPRLDCRA